MKRGYYGIGMFEPKTLDNFGGIMRSAHAFGADFVFTIGNRYIKEATDTTKAERHLPLFHYNDWSDFLEHLPKDTDIVAVEITEKATSLEEYHHPERAVYLLGGEDRTLPPEVLKDCTTVKKINTSLCLNVASCATVVMYDREAKSGLTTPRKEK